MYHQGPKHPRCKFNNFVIQAFSLAIFFSKVQCILSREDCRGGGGLLFKVGRWWRWILKLFKVSTLNVIDGF